MRTGVEPRGKVLANTHGTQSWTPALQTIILLWAKGNCQRHYPDSPLNIYSMMQSMPSMHGVDSRTLYGHTYAPALHSQGSTSVLKFQRTNTQQIIYFMKPLVVLPWERREPKLFGCTLKSKEKSG